MADHDTHDHTGVPGVGGDMSNPMTTSGDVIYGGASGTPTRLAKGTDGDVLTLASGLPSWAAGGGGGGGTGAPYLPLDAAAAADIGSGDNFSGTTLDAGWSDLQSTALTTIDASIDDFLILGNSAALGPNVHRGEKRAFSPAGDFTIWAKLQYRRVPGSYHSSSIFFGDADASDGASGNRVQLQVYRAGMDGTSSFAFEKFLGGSRTTVAGTDISTTDFWMPSDQYPLWLGLRRVGTAVSCGLSVNGVEMSWLSTTTTIAFTVATCGLAINSHTDGNPPRSIFDYIATSG